MNTKNAKSMSGKSMVAIGAGVAALATASYYFFGPKGKSHRKTMNGWMIKLKGEIIEKIEDVKELTEPIYHEIVDASIASYDTTKKVGKKELKVFADDLKAQWKDIVKEIKYSKK